jgi:hypothetical protein
MNLKLTGKGPSKMLVLGDLAMGALLIFLMVGRTYAVGSPSVAVATPTFGSGATVSVTGTGFPPSTHVKVWLDLNLDGTLDKNDPSTMVMTDASGGFTVMLNVGAVPVGSYTIDAGRGNAAEASTPVSVADVSTLAAISNAVVTLESNIGGSITTAISSIQSEITTLTSDVGKIQGTDNQILFYLDGGVPQEYNGGGVCILSSASVDAGCDTSLGGEGGQVPVGGPVTLTVWIASCPTLTTCTPDQIEAGGQVSVTLTIVESGEYVHSNSYQPLYYCTYGTCIGQDIKTLTFSAANFQIHGGCYTGAYGTNSCSDDIEVFYSWSAFEAP